MHLEQYNETEYTERNIHNNRHSQQHFPKTYKPYRHIYSEPLLQGKIQNPNYKVRTLITSKEP